MTRSTSLDNNQNWNRNWRQNCILQLHSRFNSSSPAQPARLSKPNQSDPTHLPYHEPIHLLKGYAPMKLNEKVADFTLQTDEDKTVSLSDFAGKPVILFFYPKADTPGCTIEACGFRDTFKKLQAAGTVVLGISRDTPRDQAKFRAKFDLPYNLLADVDEKVSKQFDVLKEKNMYGKTVIGIERTTFVIGPDQTLLHIYPKVVPQGHAEEVLALIEEWNKTHKKA
jgi:peroxiredoxin Q/BCP